MGNVKHQQESWSASIAKGVGTCVAVFFGVAGLGVILVALGAEPRSPGSPLVEGRVIAGVGVGVLIVLLAAAGLLCAYGRRQRPTRVRLGGLLAVDMIFIVGVMLFRLFAT